MTEATENMPPAAVMLGRVWLGKVALAFVCAIRDIALGLKGSAYSVAIFVYCVAHDALLPEPTLGIGGGSEVVPSDQHRCVTGMNLQAGDEATLEGHRLTMAQNEVASPISAFRIAIVKAFGKVTLGPTLGAIDCKLLLVEDAEATAKIRACTRHSEQVRYKPALAVEG